jgi:hypothetical protein
MMVEGIMSMWFYDDAGEMAEYQSVKEKINALEREYLELKDVLRDARQALAMDPQSELTQVRVRYLEKRLSHLEEKSPWLIWDTPVEVALFSPPHG